MKYRVWDNDAKKYFKPIYRAYAGELSELLLTPSRQVVHRTLDGFSLLDWQRGRWVVEFGSGLNDSNGNEIFQGDESEFGVITYMDGAFWYEHQNSSEVFLLREVHEGLEIIGQTTEKSNSCSRV